MGEPASSQSMSSRSQMEIGTTRVSEASGRARSLSRGRGQSRPQPTSPLSTTRRATPFRTRPHGMARCRAPANGWNVDPLENGDRVENPSRQTTSCRATRLDGESENARMSTHQQVRSRGAAPASSGGGFGPAGGGGTIERAPCRLRNDLVKRPLHLPTLPSKLSLDRA